MAVFSKFIVIVATFAGTTPLFAEEDSSATPDVYVNHGDIVLEEDGVITKFITPKALMDLGRFEIRIKKPTKEDVAPVQPVGVASLSDRIEARRIMQDANQAYFKGDIAKTWELVEQAEKLDPTFYRVITMKGSLLYKIGSTELAVEVWMESLAQNPDQPEIINVIQGIKNKTKSQLTIAKGSKTQTSKKVSNQ